MFIVHQYRLAVAGVKGQPEQATVEQISVGLALYLPGYSREAPESHHPDHAEYTDNHRDTAPRQMASTSRLTASSSPWE